MDTNSILSLAGIIVSAVIGPICVLYATNVFKKKEREQLRREEEEKRKVQESRDENFRQLHNLIDNMVKPIDRKVDDIAKELKATDAKVEEVAKDLSAQKVQTKELVEEMNAELKEIKESQRLLSKANRASLRNDLLTLYHECFDRGYTTDYDRENFLRMYTAYKAIGGNSFIETDIKPKFDNIMIKEKYDDQKLEAKKKSKKE